MRRIFVLLVVLAVVAVITLALHRLRLALDRAEARRLASLLGHRRSARPGPMTYRDPASPLELEIEQRKPGWPTWAAVGVGLPNLFVGLFVLAATASSGELAGAVVGGLVLAVGVGGLVAAVRFARRGDRVHGIIQATPTHLRWGPPDDAGEECPLEAIRRVDVVRELGRDAVEIDTDSGSLHRLDLPDDEARQDLLSFLAERTGAPIYHHGHSVRAASK